MASGVIEKLSNDSANGYCKFPDGTLIQWSSTITSAGQLRLTGSISGTTTAVITLGRTSY